MIEVVLKLAPVLLALVMLGMGLGLVPDDFRRVLRDPKAMTIGLFGQVVCLPLIAIGLVNVLPLAPEVAVGVLILAASPGGPGSNLITLLAKGDTALSVSLTAVNSLLALITVPLMTGFATGAFLGASEQPSMAGLAKIAIGVTLLTVVPVSIGMAVRAWKQSFALSMAKPVRMGAFGVLLFLIVGVAIEKGSELGALLAQAGLVDVLLCVLSIGVGALLARLGGLGVAQRRAIHIEVGIQNGALALLVTQEMLGNLTMSVPVLVYSPVMLTAAFIMIGLASIPQD